jgi:hypothetical protein
MISLAKSNRRGTDNKPPRLGKNNKGLTREVKRYFSKFRDLYYRKPEGREPLNFIQPQMVTSRGYGFCLDKSIALAAYYQILFRKCQEGREYKGIEAQLALGQEAFDYLYDFYTEKVSEPDHKTLNVRLVRTWFQWKGNSINFDDEFRNHPIVQAAADERTDHWYVQIHYTDMGRTWINVDASWPLYFSGERFSRSGKWDGRSNTKMTVKSERGSKRRYTRISGKQQKITIARQEKKPLEFYYLGDPGLYRIIKLYQPRNELSEILDEFISRHTNKTFEEAVSQY